MLTSMQIYILQDLESARDLASVSLVSAHFKRLADDSQVWKSLFNRHFGNIYGGSGASLKRLVTGVDGGRWKQLYRLQTNWKDGSVSSSHILRQALLAEPPLDLQPASTAGHSAPQPHLEAAAPESKSIVQFIGQYVFTTSSAYRHAVPSISMHRLAFGPGDPLEIGTFQPASLVNFYFERPHLLNSQPLKITEMRLDEGQQIHNNKFRLAVFFSSGQYALLRIQLQDDDNIEIFEEYVSLDIALTTRPDPVTTARYHLPLLVTVTERFVLRVHHIILNQETGEFELLLNQASLQNHLCWRPLTLNLRRKSKTHFRADLVYSSPWFPDSFTISLQEFLLTLPTGENSLGALEIQTRAATAVPLSSSARPRPLVTGIDLHGDYVVASREDNTIDLFEIIRSKTSNALRLEHRRRLFSHTCAVHSVSFDGSRCVSGARDGSLKVWHLSQQRRQPRPNRKRAIPTSNAPVYQEVVHVREPEQANELNWEEQWTANAAAGAVGALS